MKSGLLDVGSSFFGQMKPNWTCLDQTAANMFGVDLVMAMTVAA